MLISNLQLALQRIDEIRNRFEPASAPVDSANAGSVSFDDALTQALNAGMSGVPSNLEAMIQSQADEQGLDPALLKAVIKNESNFNPHAVSSAGAQGLMQLMPGTARGLGVQDSFDPAQNIQGGAKYLKGLIQKYQSVPLAVAAYNAGPGAVDKYKGVPPYAETTHYVKKVLNSYQAYQAGGSQ